MANRTDAPADPPDFIYFDLGRVLLHFDHAIACEQLAAAAGVTPQRVREVVFDSDLQHQYERGEVSTADFLRIFRQATGAAASDQALVYAAGAIFEPHVEVLELLEQVHLRRPLGVLSNTCEAHWHYAWDRFEFLRTRFRHYALSYEVGCMKPSPQIYSAARDLCAADPSRMLFIDDLPANVQGALDAGWDAIHFVAPEQLKRDLSRRGLLS